MKNSKELVRIIVDNKTVIITKTAPKKLVDMFRRAITGKEGA